MPPGRRESGYIAATCPRAAPPHPLTNLQARRIWLRAQRLDTPAPFGDGPQATAAAVDHLGYVQIDTINVIERCHHHILWTRIPGYRRADLRQAQSVDKTRVRILDPRAVLRAGKGFSLLHAGHEALTGARATAGSPTSQPPTCAR